MRTCVLVAVVAACGKSTGNDDAILATTKQRFEKMVASFDTALPACTDKLVDRDGAQWSQVALFNWADFTREAGRADSTGDQNWIETNDIAFAFANPHNPKQSKIELAREVAKRPVVAVKLVRLVKSTTGGAKLDTSSGTIQKTFEPGTADMRAVRYDADGTARCAWTIVAKNGAEVMAEGNRVAGVVNTTPEQEQLALDEDLQHSIETAIVQTVFK